MRFVDHLGAQRVALGIHGLSQTYSEAAHGLLLINIWGSRLKNDENRRISGPHIPY